MDTTKLMLTGMLTCNPSFREAEAGDCHVQGQPWLHSETYLKKSKTKLH